MTDIQNNDQINLSKILSEEQYIKNSEYNNNKTDYIPKSLSHQKYSAIINNQNKNKYINEIIDTNPTINENMIIQIKNQNNKEINKIKDLYQRKIKEISQFYELKLFDMNKLLTTTLNQYKTLSSNYIPLTEHKNIINNLKSYYNELLNKTKDNYDKLVNELTNIMKKKNKYQDLIQRLQLYTIYEIDINGIEEKLINELNDKTKNKIRGNSYYFNDYYLLSQLDEDINYHKKICELEQVYQEKLSELKINNNNQFNNLINQVKNIYENYSNYSTDKFLNNKELCNKYIDIKIDNNKNNKDIKSEINDLLAHKENECESILNSDKSSAFICQNSSQEIDNLLNMNMSNENHIKPESMKINCMPSSLK